MVSLSSFYFIKKFLLFQYSGLKNLGEKGDFPGIPVRGLIERDPSLLCASVNVTSLLDAEKILSEYLNNRNPLMSPMVHLENS